MAGILYSLFISGDRAASLQLLISGLIAGYFTRLMLRNLVATRGTIARDGVELEAVALYWFCLHGPPGRFPLQGFSGVPVERGFPPGFAQGGPPARGAPMGKTGTPHGL